MTLREQVARGIWESWARTPTFKQEWSGISWDTISAEKDKNRAAAHIYETAFIETDAAISIIFSYLEEPGDDVIGEMCRALCLLDGYTHPDEDWRRSTNGVPAASVAMVEIPDGQTQRWRNYERKARKSLHAALSQARQST